MKRTQDDLQVNDAIYFTVSGKITEIPTKNCHPFYTIELDEGEGTFYISDKDLDKFQIGRFRTVKVFK